MSVSNPEKFRHERAQNFADLFKGTPHERAYWNWRGLQQANDNNEAVYSEQDVVNCECLCAGIDLVLGTVASRLKLNDFLADCFGTALADKILSLAYYCVNSRTLSCPRKSSYVPVCQLVKGIYLFK